MKIYWVMLEVAPSDENEEYKGAFLNCWVKAESEQEAIEAKLEAKGVTLREINGKNIDKI